MPIIDVIGRNCASLLVSVGHMPNCWCKLKGACPIVGVSGEDICQIVGVNARAHAQLLVSVVGIVPQGPDKSNKRATSGPPVTQFGDQCTKATHCIGSPFVSKGRLNTRHINAQRNVTG